MKPNEYGNAVADKQKLIRRAYFDLLGLPPTPEQVAAFVTNDDPQAYEQLLDELMANPHYGERWARHWMDVARFAESHGYEQDYDRDSNVIEVFIKRLRQKLDPEQSLQPIETLRRQGYRFTLSD